MDRFLIPLYDYATGGPPRAWECPICRRVVRTLKGAIRHMLITHKMKQQEDLFEGQEMNFYLISDTHFNHAKIATYCDRPANFTDVLIRNWRNTIKQEDTIIHLGDVFIGPTIGWDEIYESLPGNKILVRGNHDRNRSLGWWMSHGFGFACDGISRNCWLTHEPDTSRASGCDLNIHGHLHNIWHGFAPNAGDEKDATETKRFS